MTDIGHNNPPRHEAFAMEADELFTTASDTLEGMDAVQTEQQDAALDSLKDDLRRVAKDAEAARKEEKEPHLEAGRAVDAAYKPVADKCKSAIVAIAAMQTPYRVAKQAAKDEAARIKREEAEALEKAAQDKLKNGEHLQAAFDAEAELEQARKLKAVANKADREATGLRTRQIAVVTDYRALLLHIAATDKSALDAWLDEYARKSLPAQLPGVTIELERKAA